MNIKTGFLIFLAFLFIPSFDAFSQNRVTKGEHHLFPGFRKAAVYLHSGKIQEMELNYNLLTEEMVFVQGGQFLAISNPETIDSIRMENRKFVPVKGLFYEQLGVDPIPLFKRHKNKLLATGKSTGFGTSQTTAVDNISDIVSTGKVYELELQGEFTLMSESSYWILKNNEFLRFNSTREISRIFPEKAAAVKQYLKLEKVDFTNQMDVKKLLDFLVPSVE